MRFQSSLSLMACCLSDILHRRQSTGTARNGTVGRGLAGSRKKRAGRFSGFGQPTAWIAADILRIAHFQA